MEKKLQSKKVKEVQSEKINFVTVEIIEKNIKNFLISTKNQEAKVDSVLEAVSGFKTEFQAKIRELFEKFELKEGDKIPEDKLTQINEEYRKLMFELIDTDKEKFSHYTEEEFSTVTTGLVLPYNELKILKYWLIKQV